jgi:hypothetical protein
MIHHRPLPNPAHLRHAPDRPIHPPKNLQAPISSRKLQLFLYDFIAAPVVLPNVRVAQRIWMEPPSTDECIHRIEFRVAEKSRPKFEVTLGLVLRA